MNMLKVEFRKVSRGLIIWILALSGFITMYLAFYESVSELFLEKMDMLPDVMLGMFRLDTLSGLAGYNNYYATIITFMVLGASCYACIIGAGLFIREEGEGTIEFLNARPVTRTRIITAKLCATSLAMLLLVLAMTAVSFACGALFSGGADYTQSVLGIALLCYTPLFVFLYIGCLISVALRKAGSATPAALGVLFFSYIIGAIAGMVEPLSFLKWVSPLDYVPTISVISSSIGGGTSSMDYTGMFVSLAIILTCITATYLIYRKRDLMV